MACCRDCLIPSREAAWPDPDGCAPLRPESTGHWPANHHRGRNAWLHLRRGVTGLEARESVFRRIRPKSQCAIAAMDGERRMQMAVLHGRCPIDCASITRSGRACSPRFDESCGVSLQRLENPCRAHAGTNAHGDHAVLLLTTTHAVDEGSRAHRAGGAEWMAQGNGAT